MKKRIIKAEILIFVIEAIETIGAIETIELSAYLRNQMIHTEYGLTGVDGRERHAAEAVEVAALA